MLQHPERSGSLAQKLLQASEMCIRACIVITAETDMVQQSGQQQKRLLLGGGLGPGWPRLLRISAIVLSSSHLARSLMELPKQTPPYPSKSQAAAPPAAQATTQLPGL